METPSDLDRLGNEIAELSAHLEAATARLLERIREFDAREGWNTGFRSCAAWLSYRVGLDIGAARERVRVARALHVYQDDDGTVTVRGRLTAEAGALLMRALDAARDELYRKRTPEDDPPTMPQQQADALTLLAETALHHGVDPGAPGERYQVVIHVDVDVLEDADRPGQSVLEDGARVSAETSQRLACDAGRVVMRHGAEGQIVEIGARTRTIPPAIRRALHHRDRGCRFPGCGVRIGEGHHIRHWARGGPTTLSNLAVLCRRHHRAVHEEGYRVERQPDGALAFFRPNGWLVPEAPSPPPLAGDPLETLRMANATGGMHVDSQTIRPGWLGERLDVGWAIDVLHPRANPLKGPAGTEG